MEKTKSFFSKIVGTSFVPNSRQLLTALNKGDQLNPIREEDNKFDANAIRIENMDGIKLGYIPGHTAVNLAKDMDNGCDVRIKVDAITGGGEKNVGCNLLIEIFGEINDESDNKNTEL